MYRLNFSSQGEASFASLDRARSQHIFDKLKWLVQNIDTINHKKLRENLSGLYKLRIGDWRVIYEIDRSTEVITIHIQFWVDSSDDNYKSMLNMYTMGEYMWALFIGHLAIEKLLKAYYIKIVGQEVPRTHDLYKLAIKSNMALLNKQKDALQYITLFNIETRYEDYKKDFYKKCTQEFADENIEKIKELRTWLKQKIKA